MHDLWSHLCVTSRVFFFPSFFGHFLVFILSGLFPQRYVLQYRYASVLALCYFPTSLSSSFTIVLYHTFHQILLRVYLKYSLLVFWNAARRNRVLKSGFVRCHRSAARKKPYGSSIGSLTGASVPLEAPPERSMQPWPPSQSPV